LSSNTIVFVIRQAVMVQHHLWCVEKRQRKRRKWTQDSE
jgi:hypothetical protein